MNKIILFVLAGSGFIGVGSFSFTYYNATRGPRVQWPAVVDLGVQDLGKRLVTQFPIRNAGRETLVLEKFRTSCGCLSVTERSEHGKKPVDRVEVGPGMVVTLVAEVSSRGKVGGSLHERITFATNDPAQPEVNVAIVTVLQGQIIAVPTALHVGEMVVGQSVTKVIELCDTGRKEPFILRDVSNSCPDLIQVKEIRPVTASEVTSQSAARRPLYRLSLQIRAPHAPGQLDEKLTFHGEGDGAPILDLPISARIIPIYRLDPPALVLPRGSDAGLVYRASTACICADSKPFQLQVSDMAPGFKISFSDRQKDGSILVAVEYSAGEVTTPGRRVIRLMATREGKSHELELPVLCWRPKE